MTRAFVTGVWSLKVSQGFSPAHATCKKQAPFELSHLWYIKNKLFPPGLPVVSAVNTARGLGAVLEALSQFKIIPTFQIVKIHIHILYIYIIFVYIHIYIYQNSCIFIYIDSFIYTYLNVNCPQTYWYIDLFTHIYVCRHTCR